MLLKTTATGTSGPGNAAERARGDIDIASAISWASANTLTLDAYHAINITAPVTASGAGKVMLITNDGGTGGDYSFGLGPGGFAGALSFTGTPGSGQALTINGNAYTLLYSMSDVASIAVSAEPGYALAESINASATTYADAVVSGTFEGRFTGLGNTISNLTIFAPLASDVGLFQQIGTQGRIDGIRLANANVTGLNEVGALVGPIRGSFKTRRVPASSLTHRAPWATASAAWSARSAAT